MAKENEIKRLTGKGRINRKETTDDLEPKSWWSTSRRRFIIGGAVAAGVAVTGGGIWLANRDDTTEVDQDSLELQRASGWNVGSEETRLTFTGAQTVDSQGSNNWTRYLDQSMMLSAYQPKSERWMPFFVPTLIQSLQFDSLRSQMTPILTPDMQEAYGRGQSIAKDFLANAENKGETAIIVDVPGRTAVAFAAGLADASRLVPTFDNFPHPLGVTPSHETLGAMLYYAAEIEAKQQNAPNDAPPLFLLDSQRLAPYADADKQFDNRYLAKLPTAQKFQEAGIKSLIYITPDRTRTEELDDLNEAFVEYKNGGINTAMLPLSDFVRAQGGAAQTGGSGVSFDDNSGSRYYYGGSPATHIWFFYSYPFYRASPAFATRYPGAGNLSPGRAPALAPPVSPPRYAPVPRPTMFAGSRVGSSTGAGVGRSKPSGFGRSTVRVAPSGGVVGTRAGRSGYYSPSRSGSFGRGGGYGG